MRSSALRGLARQRLAFLLVVGAVMSGGCGGAGKTADAGDAGGPGGDSGTDAGVTDDQPPQLRDLAVMLGEPNPGPLDLGMNDAERVILMPTPLTFRLLASDDVTAPESLHVELVDPTSGMPLADQSASFASGLWDATTTAAPGVTVTIRATDEAGNTATWPHAAVFPTRTDALTRSWTVLGYNMSAVVVSRRTSTWGNGIWCTDGDSATQPVGGSYSVDAAGLLTVDERHHLACNLTDYGAEWNTIEHSLTGPFFVDDTYMSEVPLTRMGTGTGVGGTWTDNVTNDGVATVVTLDLRSDDTFSWTLPDATVHEGTYMVVPNSSYVDNFGDLIVTTTTRINGANVTPQTEVHFYALRQGLLLLDPFVDVQGAG